MAGLWPWAALAGLGAFHGLNPAMGWLFAVALGLHRKNRTVVLASLVPLTVGHLASAGLVALAFVVLGLAVDPRLVRNAAGGLLIGWAIYHYVYGHRHRVRVGLTTGMAGLALWSFMMATAHGAGLMLVPVLMPLCLVGFHRRRQPLSRRRCGPWRARRRDARRDRHHRHRSLRVDRPRVSAPCMVQHRPRLVDCACRRRADRPHRLSYSDFAVSSRKNRPSGLVRSTARAGR